MARFAGKTRRKVSMSSSTIDLYLASDLIRFSAGLVLNGLFLILVLKSARLPGTPRANLFLSACSLTWNLGGLVHSCMIAMGKTDESDPSSIFMAIKLIAAIAWPIPALMIWQHYSQPLWKKICSVVLQIVAAGGVIAASVGFLSPFVFGIAPLPASEVKKLATEFISSFGIALLIFGTALLLKGRLSRAIWLSYFTVLLGIFGSAVALFLHHALTLPVSCDTALLVLSKQSTLLILFGSFFLFARFRFADVFIRQSFRTLLAAAMAVVWVLLIRGPFLAEITSHTAA